MVFFCTTQTSAQQSDNTKIDFAHDIVPVLKKHCSRCHSNGTYDGGFSIDNRAAIIESGTVVPGSADQSELVDRIESDDEEYRMPHEGQPLSQPEINALKNWIDTNLPWEPGFNFKKTTWRAPLKPRRVTPPDCGNCTPGTGDTGISARCWSQGWGTMPRPGPMPSGQFRYIRTLSPTIRSERFCYAWPSKLDTTNPSF